MKGYVQDIKSIAVRNENFRRVLYTAKHCQLVVMALKPKEEIGAGRLRSGCPSRSEAQHRQHRH